jgi:hypothetical protein
LWSAEPFDGSAENEFGGFTGLHVCSTCSEEVEQVWQFRDTVDWLCGPCTMLASRPVLACAVCNGEPRDVQRHRSTRGFIWVCVGCRTGQVEDRISA